ncbi:MAG: molybdate ABC transporter substrate-binding protein [Lysobacteraceae bacterium]|nr:MAG: molybdate ABC transporter substrate-binding protein [Xanthomonadaceae bacterium]
MNPCFAKRLFLITFCLALSACENDQNRSPVLNVAVASNFRAAATELSQAFSQQSGIEIRLSAGSTGKHYAQILNGAPFDVFLAADTRRPRLLDEKNLIQPNSRITYAIGKLVLWSPDQLLIEGQGLPDKPFAHLAIANPELAPYGLAAQQALQSLGRWDDLASTMVRGENVGQVMQYVISGNAELGFVSAAQLIELDDRGSRWEIPPTLHQPIQQQAVQLSNDDAATAFMSFLVDRSARAIIAKHGYHLP